MLLRTDATPAIGSGHVMRCLCLADALRLRGAEAVFLSRGLPQHLRELVVSHGHGLIDLPPLSAPTPGLPEAVWPESLQREDADQVRAAAGAPAHWLVVDHYGLDASWEQAARSCAGSVMAIDDLGRNHSCDLLLDQNAHEDAAGLYQRCLSAGAQGLFGPRYVLLRPEFAQLRASARVRDGDVHEILVFLGGMDTGNATGRVLDALQGIRPPECIVNVVIGAAHPAREAVESMAAQHAWLHCHVQTERMASLCASADLAIGAGGTATWERCALGLPAVALCLAPNQQLLLHGAARHGLVYATPPDLDTAALQRHIAAVIDNPGLRNHLSRAGMEQVDGLGTRRVVARLLAQQVRVRPATEADAEMLRHWRNQPEVRAASRNKGEIAAAGHLAWVRRVLSSPAHDLLVGEYAGQPIGSVRFDVAADEAEVSIYMGPQPEARGLGLALLQAAQAWLKERRPQVLRVRAEVLGDNQASHHLFAACGYQRTSTSYLYRY
jgi:UDP-2,4-diacetamido-2,4,6-trideoxy-beta-L-altropyranose hydrolase